MAESLSGNPLALSLSPAKPGERRLDVPLRGRVVRFRRGSKQWADTFFSRAPKRLRCCSVLVLSLSLIALAPLTGCGRKPVGSESAAPREDGSAEAAASDAPSDAASDAGVGASSSTARSGESAGSRETRGGEDAAGDSGDPSRLDAVVPRFEVVAADRGLDFRRYEDIRGQRRIFESTGGGVAMLDIDLDGRLDLMFPDACVVPASDAAENAPDVPRRGGRVFRNRGEMRFSDVTVACGVIQTGYGQGCAVGDYDADGFDDLYVTALGENTLWRNNGDGTFSDVTDSWGVGVPAWSTGCAFADVNTDGHLDLVVINYLRDSPDDPLLCPNPAAPSGYVQCPPSKYEGVDDVLLINDGQGGFVDRSREVGWSDRGGRGLGVVVAQFNDGGLPEIYVANDGQANFLWVAHEGEDRAGAEDREGAGQGGRGTSGQLVYRDRGLVSGAALSRSGFAQASMGIAAGDIDGDGRLDLILTHFYGDSNTVYRNRGGLRFADATRTSGLSGPSRQVLGWGAVLEDFSGDGRPDLFVANGHVEDRGWQEHPEPFAMPPQLFLNGGAGRFVDVSDRAGNYFDSAWKGRGVAAGDLDDDGRVDLAVANLLEPAVVLHNRTAEAASGCRCRFIGRDSNRGGIGVRVELLDESGAAVARRQLVGGGSYLSASAGELVLGAGRKPVSIRIEWPSGRLETHRWEASHEQVFTEKRGDIRQ